ncbi:MAG TPA: hypothetical protein PLN52_22665 [Opitutaceae bacterium]|nr:hypothetical protein [Opitutaceae bacterium]
MTATTDFPRLDVVSHLPLVADVVAKAGLRNADLTTLLNEVATGAGVCTCYTALAPSRSTWLMAFVLDEGIRLIAVQSPDNDFLAGLHYDVETWVAAEQRAGRQPTKRDVVRNILEAAYGDRASAELSRMEMEGLL